jgi:hypothetical protein
MEIPKRRVFANTFHQFVATWGAIYFPEKSTFISLSLCIVSFVSYFVAFNSSVLRPGSNATRRCVAGIAFSGHVDKPHKEIAFELKRSHAPQDA